MRGVPLEKAGTSPGLTGYTGSGRARKAIRFLTLPAHRKREAGAKMSEELQVQQDLTKDLLSRLENPRETVRETAAEALAVAAGDEDWRPDDLILCDGIGTIIDLLGEKNAHIVRSALSIILAIANAGHEEGLLSHGVIDGLERLQNHRDPLIRRSAREAFWLLTPDVEDVVTHQETGEED
jgi:hypothetical protein